ncbi:hypothetical protein ACH5RR_033058 [Cinchona calisaya]|uniref:Uncharacterized protein n=1 Tax=Cinchona calisaya TaxID=153742 RepID=A0ABD2YL75_9GENT
MPVVPWCLVGMAICYGLPRCRHIPCGGMDSLMVADAHSLVDHSGRWDKLQDRTQTPSCWLCCQDIVSGISMMGISSKGVIICQYDSYFVRIEAGRSVGLSTRISKAARWTDLATLVWIGSLANVHDRGTKAVKTSVSGRSILVSSYGISGIRAKTWGYDILQQESKRVSTFKVGCLAEFRVALGGRKGQLSMGLVARLLEWCWTVATGSDGNICTTQAFIVYVSEVVDSLSGGRMSRAGRWLNANSRHLLEAWEVPLPSLGLIHACLVEERHNRSQALAQRDANRCTFGTCVLLEVWMAKEFCRKIEEVEKKPTQLTDCDSELWRESYDSSLFLEK